MELTVGDLKKKIENMSDETPVFIERIEDIYFKKYNWKSKKIVFQVDEKGISIDETEITRASCVGSSVKNNRVIIYAHI